MLRGIGSDDRALAQGSMGIATGDFDRDRDIDFYVTNFFQEYNTYYECEAAAPGMIKPSNSTSVNRLCQWSALAARRSTWKMMELILTNGHVDQLAVDSVRQRGIPTGLNRHSIRRAGGKSGASNLNPPKQGRQG
jgi:hypothetical protein